MKNKTVDFYNKKAKEWAKTRVAGKGSYREGLVNEFKEILPVGKVLEIGCGSGLEAKILVDNGFDYVGIDASKEMVKMSMKLNPDLKFIEMSVEKLNFPKNSFDGFWSSATLLHVRKKKIDSVLKKIKKVCKSKAIGLITLKQGVGEGEEKETGRWFSFYKKEEFEKILIKNEFEIVKFEVIKDFREGLPDWLIFFVKIL